MRAVILGGPQLDALIEERRAKGLDIFDEVWDGVLHMSPSPNAEHQRICYRLGILLSTQIEDRGRGRVYPSFNVADPERGLEEFRIPDLCVVLEERESIIRDAYVAGGPDLVIEVESPGDETREKIAFYGRIGVREMLIVHRDTKAIERWALEGDALVLASATPAPVRSEVLDVVFERVEVDGAARIRAAAGGRIREI